MSKNNNMQRGAPLTHPVSNSIDAATVCDEALAKFTNALMQQPLWHLVSKAEGAVSGVLNAQTGLRYPPANELTSFLQSHSFLFVLDNNRNTLATLHTTTRHLWHCLDQGSEFALRDGKTKAAESRAAGLQGWRLATKDMLERFAKAESNPHRVGNKYRLHDKYHWLTAGGRCYVNEGYWDVDLNGSGFIFVCHNHWTNASPEQLLADLAARGWQLASPNDQASFPLPEVHTVWQGFDSAQLMRALHEAGWQLQSLDGKVRLDPDPLAFLYDLDYTPCRLPRLETAQLTDPHKGLWELWGNDAAQLKRLGLVARDPARDVCTRNVAIDFGTSSTVVALVDERGGRRLLRIGVRDFYQPPCAADFENPTALEVIDYAQLHAAWTARAYRPPLDWNWLHAAHEAQASFRDNPGDTAVLASILPRLKQWARRSAKEALRITDRQDREIELPALTERNPVRGEPMTAGADDPFDPIELYAWFLGMAINWRGLGLHCKYHLTFPVKYEREVKDKILSSFRRGLQRSLPPTLVVQPTALQPFSVTEIASEPAAYAAAALPHLGLEPKLDGVFYAVFDFGGGTTDFDFGQWRWANDQETEEGYDQVFEHLHSSGDNYLGGENLLEHLVYACFRHNLAVCREQKIHFTRPLDGERFTGDEAFVHATQAAQTNTVLLAAKLRGFLESADGRLDAQLKIDLLDKDGKKKTCELSLDKTALDQLLFARMESGVRAFLTELAAIRGDLPEGQPVQVLLAGNGSRSRHIATLFDKESDHWPRLLQECFGDTHPELIIHSPLPIDESDHHSPTAKTGVALGMLRLCPGESVKLIDHVRSTSHDEAPFRYFVGKLGRREEFTPVLDPRTTYQQWHLLGPLPQGVFKLCYSVSLRARDGMRQGDPELRIQRLDFPAVAPQDKLFARAISPTTIELACAPDEATLSSQPDLPRQTRDLEIGQP
jgi:hypothetical protein